MSHTEGPWEYSPWTTSGGRVTAGVVFEKLHLYITSHNPNYSDDARLIGAAPDLHTSLGETLEALTWLINNAPDNYWIDWARTAELESRIERARAAIEKAGQQ